ncbi:MAG: TM2 domain-containing protein [Coriobacteriia bacterium]|nr:TM2 domain-containing protein [Coriobacteriia bacterium]
MKGTILEVSFQNNSGVISGEDGGRYCFSANQWCAQGNPRKGQRVDFLPASNEATQIYPMASSSGFDSLTEGEKNRTVAALLAVVLGSVGAHKFYLGYKAQGIIMVALTASGWVLTSVLIGALWAWIPGLVGLIEGIIYFTKSDEEFEQTYVVGQRHWF